MPRHAIIYFVFSNARATELMRLAHTFCLGERARERPGFQISIFDLHVMDTGIEMQQRAFDN